MKRTLTLSFALAAGLFGGLLSRYITPPPALAQSGAPKEIKAQSFVLVDDKKNLVGTFTASPSKPLPGRSSTVVLLDPTGKEIWRAGLSFKSLSER